ncbi:hypothetical protein FSY45_00035 [Comamonas sp. Z1]|uniref:hypothetical protein n=1 Tax=Comamonas sp. Z1 TaxID=2601246 RepID=UPI0011E7A0CC|nr:hypothetical protein [Comamonas sp. Z1]TYK77388.1 hypothetical protein FSY45_00035 [Comamonas sp. Z1]
MKEKLKTLRARAMVLALSAGPALAMAADPADPVAAIGQAKTDISLIILAGGAALVSLALLGVGWVVGARFVKKLGRAG